MTDIHSITPTYRSGRPEFPKLVDVGRTPDGDYAATLTEWYFGEPTDEVGYGSEECDAIHDLMMKVVDTKLTGEQLAALEAWLVHCHNRRPESERAGFSRCIDEVLEVFG